jgi:hypothetical protein
MPSSFITAIASDLTRPGRVPALSISKRSPASCLSNPSTIWLRAEFPVQRINTRFHGLGAATGGAAPSSGLAGSNKGTDEFAFHFCHQRIHVKTPPRQEVACVFDAVNPCGLDTDVFETRTGKL